MRTRLSTLLAAVIAAVLSTSAAAQGSGPVDSLPTGVTEAMIEKGNEVFHKAGLCYACHGSEAKGLVGPNLTDDVWLHSKGTYQEIVTQVSTGVTKEESKSGIVMPPKGGSSISDDEVEAVAAYVWSLSHLKPK
ncbi:MAG: c-type cytochrome [Gemmatimonadales bacterium]